MFLTKVYTTEEVILLKKYWNKYTRSALIVLVGMILALIAFQLNNKQIAEQVQTRKIIVAKINISPYMPVTKEQLEYRNVVISEVPNDALDTPEDIDFNDVFASKYGFIQGMPIRTSLITTAADSELGTAVTINEGMRQIGIKTDLALSSGDEVKPGILVDAYAFITDSAGQGKSVVAPELAGLKVVKRINSEGKVPDPAGSGSLVPAVVVLEVTPQQAAQLVEYQETGKVYLLPSGTALSK